MTLPFLLAASLQPGGCRMIDADAILARDVAVVVPAFARLPGDFNLGYAPLSGTPRIFRGADLQAIARNRGVDLDGLPDVCFERRTAILTATEIREAMRSSLGIDGAKIEVTAWSQHAAPAGEVVFPRAGLQFSDSHPEAIWNGYIRYAGDRDFPIWAKARITANMTRVVALTTLPAGKPIRGNQVRLESCEDSPLDETVARNLDEVIAYLPKTPLRALAPIRKSQLERPPDVDRGDLVKVEVFEGSAHLVLEGRAQAPGMKGSTILVRNPSSGKDFSAVVTGKDQVTVQ